MKSQHKILIVCGVIVVSCGCVWGGLLLADKQVENEIYTEIDDNLIFGIGGTKLAENAIANETFPDTFGAFPSAANAAMGFKVTSDGYAISDIVIRLRKQGSPVDTITMRIYEGTLANGVLIGTSNAFDGSTLTTSLANVTFTFPTVAPVETGTQYHYALLRSGGFDESNYYLMGSDDSPSYADGQTWKDTNGSWTVQTDRDAVFEVYGDEYTPPSDSCSPAAGGQEWEMLLTDNCNISTDIYHNAGIICYGTGDFVIEDGVNVVVASSTNCKPTIKGSGAFYKMPVQVGY